MRWGQVWWSEGNCLLVRGRGNNRQGPLSVPCCRVPTARTLPCRSAGTQLWFSTLSLHCGWMGWGPRKYSCPRHPACAPTNPLYLVVCRYATDLAAMPEPRARLAAAAVDNDTIVVVGGEADE